MARSQEHSWGCAWGCELRAKTRDKLGAEQNWVVLPPHPTWRLVSWALLHPPNVLPHTPNGVHPIVWGPLFSRYYLTHLVSLIFLVTNARELNTVYLHTQAMVLAVTMAWSILKNIGQQSYSAQLCEESIPLTAIAMLI